VAGVGQQRQRIGEETVDDLRDDERDVQRRRDREVPAEVLRLEDVRVAVVGVAGVIVMRMRAMPRP
jgi:hypothetical protein